MTTDYKQRLNKLLGNHGLEIAEQVATERLKLAGVTLGKDLGLSKTKPAKKDRFSTIQVKRLAGG